MPNDPQKIHQLYCTHCTHRTSYLHQRDGAIGNQPFEYAVRAGSVERATCHDEFRRIEPLLSFPLPQDTPATELLNLDADKAKARGLRRLVYFPSISGMRMAACVSYRTTDTTGRPGAYFAHVLFQDEPKPTVAPGFRAAGQPENPRVTGWSAEEVLELWDFHKWQSKDGEGLGPELPALDALAHFRNGNPVALDETLLHQFVTFPPNGPFRDVHNVLPPRWRAMPVETRRRLLADVVQAFLSIEPAGLRQSVALAVEPSVAALLFYGVAKLIPARGPIEDLSFSTLEADVARPRTALVATTWFNPDAPGRLSPDAYRPGRFAFDTWRLDDASAQTPCDWRRDGAPPCYGTTLVDLLAGKGWDAVRDLLKRLNDPGLLPEAPKRTDLDELVQADAYARDRAAPAGSVPKRPKLAAAADAYHKSVALRLLASHLSTPKPPPPPPGRSAPQPQHASSQATALSLDRAEDQFELLTADGFPTDPALKAAADLRLDLLLADPARLSTLLRNDRLRDRHPKLLLDHVRAHGWLPNGCEEIFQGENARTHAFRPLLGPLLRSLSFDEAAAFLDRWVDTFPNPQSGVPLTAEQRALRAIELGAILSALLRSETAPGDRSRLACGLVDHLWIPQAVVDEALRNGGAWRKTLFQRYPDLVPRPVGDPTAAPQTATPQTGAPQTAAPQTAATPTSATQVHPASDWGLYDDETAAPQATQPQAAQPQAAQPQGSETQAAARPRRLDERFDEHYEDLPKIDDRDAGKERYVSHLAMLHEAAEAGLPTENRTAFLNRWNELVDAVGNMARHWDDEPKGMLSAWFGASDWRVTAEKHGRWVVSKLHACFPDDDHHDAGKRVAILRKYFAPNMEWSPEFQDRFNTALYNGNEWNPKRGRKAASSPFPSRPASAPSQPPGSTAVGLPPRDPAAAESPADKLKRQKGNTLRIAAALAAVFLMVGVSWFLYDRFAGEGGTTKNGAKITDNSTNDDPQISDSPGSKRATAKAIEDAAQAAFEKFKASKQVDQLLDALVLASFQDEKFKSRANEETKAVELPKELGGNGPLSSSWRQFQIQLGTTREKPPDIASDEALKDHWTKSYVTWHKTEHVAKFANEMVARAEFREALVKAWNDRFLGMGDDVPEPLQTVFSAFNGLESKFLASLRPTSLPVDTQDQDYLKRAVERYDQKVLTEIHDRLRKRTADSLSKLIEGDKQPAKDLRVDVARDFLFATYVARVTAKDPSTAVAGATGLKPAVPKAVAAEGKPHLAFVQLKAAFDPQTVPAAGEFTPKDPSGKFRSGAKAVSVKIHGIAEIRKAAEGLAENQRPKALPTVRVGADGKTAEILAGEGEKAVDLFKIDVSNGTARWELTINPEKVAKLPAATHVVALVPQLVVEVVFEFLPENNPAKTDTTKPDETKPDAAGSDGAKPDTKELQPATPDATKPDVTNEDAPKDAKDGAPRKEETWCFALHTRDLTAMRGSPLLLESPSAKDMPFRGIQSYGLTLAAVVEGEAILERLENKKVLASWLGAVLSRQLAFGADAGIVINGNADAMVKPQHPKFDTGLLIRFPVPGVVKPLLVDRQAANMGEAWLQFTAASKPYLQLESKPELVSADNSPHNKHEKKVKHVKEAITELNKLLKAIQNSLPSGKPKPPPMLGLKHMTGVEKGVKQDLENAGYSASEQVVVAENALRRATEETKQGPAPAGAPAGTIDPKLYGRACKLATEGYEKALEGIQAYQKDLIAKKPAEFPKVEFRGTIVRRVDVGRGEPLEIPVIHPQGKVTNKVVGDAAESAKAGAK